MQHFDAVNTHPGNNAREDFLRTSVLKLRPSSAWSVFSHVLLMIVGLLSLHPIFNMLHIRIGYPSFPNTGSLGMQTRSSGNSRHRLPGDAAPPSLLLYPNRQGMPRFAPLRGDASNAGQTMGEEVASRAQPVTAPPRGERAGGIGRFPLASSLLPDRTNW